MLTFASNSCSGLLLSFILAISSVSCLYSHGDDVVILNDENFSQVTTSENLWFVTFYTPWCGHSKNAAPDWKQFATHLKGVVKVGAVDAEASPSVAQKYGIKGYPTIMIFGDKKKNPTTYQGGRGVRQLTEEALRVVTSTIKTRSGADSSSGGGGSDVIELTDSNFDEKVLKSEEPWLVEFYAPWCGHCKNLKPQWEKAATGLKGVAKVGALDATVHKQMSQRYGIRGFPTIKFFPAGSKSDSPIDYNGDRSSESIVSWTNDKVEVSAPSPNLLELTSTSVYKEACEQNTLCIISFLPMLYDCQAECRKKYLELIRTEIDIFKRQKWGWIWTEAMKHPDLENVLEVGGFGYPALVAIHGRKMKRTTMRGSFSSTGIHDFLRALFAGGANLPLYSLNRQPEINTVSEWDGNNAPLVEDIDKTEL